MPSIEDMGKIDTIGIPEVREVCIVLYVIFMILLEVFMMYLGYEYY